MTSVDNRPLRVFLCHSSNDKPAVRELYEKLRAESWISPWLDEEELYPGQDWNMEIEKAVEAADAIIVCLTKNSINKEGYVQRELRIVLDFADYKPEGTLYIIPVRLEECEPPRRLRAWQYADYFEGQRERAFQRLLVSLKRRAVSLELEYEEKPIMEKNGEEMDKRKTKEEVDRLAAQKAEEERAAQAKIESERKAKKEAHRLAAQKAEEERAAQAKIESERKAEEERVAQAKIESERKAKKEADRLAAQKAEEKRVALAKIESKPRAKKEESEVKAATHSREVVTPKIITSISNKITLSYGLEFMHVPAGKFIMGSRDDNKLAYNNEKPQHTVDIPYDYWIARFTVTKKLFNTYLLAIGSQEPISGLETKGDHPVVGVNWINSIDYCKWLNNLLKAELRLGLVLRLPTEAEWEKAARGLDGREYPWGNQFDKMRCNAYGGGKNSTTRVGLYSPQGDSPYGCADMSGNVWEWTHSSVKAYPYYPNDGRENEVGSSSRVLRGGSFDSSYKETRCLFRFISVINNTPRNFGFRICIAPPLPK